MDNCKHLQPRTITHELVLSCAWCGSVLQRSTSFEDTQNSSNDFTESETTKFKCTCWAFGKNIPMWAKRLYRAWSKLNNKYNNNIFME